MFHLTPFLTLRSQSFLPSPLITNEPNVLCVCIFGVTFTYVIEGIDSKVLSVCLIIDYSLIADLHIFVYARAECKYISLKCTKAKLSIY